MSGQRLMRLLCATNPGGSESVLDRVFEAADRHDAQVVALVGNLGEGAAAGETYRPLFHGLARAVRPTYWVPGPDDAPVDHLLREAHNLEVVASSTHCVHGTAAFAPDHVLFAGLGGEISDDPDAARDEAQRLRYPRWEPEFRLKLLRDLEEHQKVLLFWSRPAHKGSGAEGSDVLAELINTYRPRIVVCAGDRGVTTLGKSLVVAPGSLADGHYAVADLHAREATLEEFAAVET
jgi:uncharacterized protein